MISSHGVEKAKYNPDRHDEDDLPKDSVFQDKPLENAEIYNGRTQIKFFVKHYQYLGNGMKTKHRLIICFLIN